MEETKVKQRWKDYFKNLLNQKNLREKRKLGTENSKRDVGNISMKEIRNVLRKMKKTKPQGPNNILVGVWMALGTKGVQFLANLFNRLLRKMPNEWRRSVLVPLHKEKGGVKE